MTCNSVSINIIIIIIVMISMGIVPSVTTAIVLQISLLFSRFIPSISEIGIFQYICILVLSEVSVDHSTAFTFGVILHVVLILPYLIIKR